MKTYLILFALAVLALSCDHTSQQHEEVSSAEEIIVTGYDSLLATEVGADAYGMRKYVMALLKKGPNRDQDSLEAANLQAAHMANINRMAEDGKLVMAGPFFDDWEVSGIYIFAVESIEEAEALTNSDPAIQAGRLEMELHPWYGSAALMMMNDLHNQVSKEGI